MLRAAQSLRKPTRLRDYQRDDLLELAAGWERHLHGESSAMGLEAPMGSGKTTTVKACAAWLLLERRARLVVVAAPLDAVVGQWAVPGHFADPLVDPAERGGRLPAPVPSAAAGQTWGQAPRATSAQLADPTWWATAEGYYVCSRQAMCTQRAVAAMEGADVELRDVLAVGDEGHHHGEGTYAGAMFAALRARGACTLLVSGTPWHGDGSVFTADTHVVRRSAASLLAYPDRRTGKAYVPTHWRPQRVLVADLETDRADWVAEPDREATPVQFTARYIRRMCDAVAKHWAAEGCPRVVVNLPGVAWAGPMRAALVRHGAGALGREVVLVDLVGDMHDTVRAERQARLAADGAAKQWNHPARVDVVLSVARMDEGTDWPPCSAVYNVRIPSSPLRILQRWARAGRGKWEIAGYPEKWADEMRMVFFVPRLTGQAVEDVWRQHREQAVLLAAYLADHEEARRWVDPQTVARAQSARRHAAGRKLPRGSKVAASHCDPPPANGRVIERFVTCTSLTEHRGVWVGYLDPPTWARNERNCVERELSLAVPLAKATVYSDFGRAKLAVN